MKTTHLVGTTFLVLGLVTAGSASPMFRAILNGNLTPKEQIGQTPVPQLSKAERDGLIFMREEEKLAYDVYTVFDKKWGSRPFGNITASEQTHMAAVKGLLDRYGIADPIVGRKPGEFKDKTLQKLYNDLIKTGSTSRIEALRAGATIEDVDLFDLARWSKETKNPDILAVYANLERGSRNHLRAFSSNLSRQGTPYKPKYLTQKAYDAIIAAPMERGRGGG